METETYKNAKLILERFDPDAKRKAVSVCVYICVVYIKTVCFFSWYILYALVLRILCSLCPLIFCHDAGARVHSSPTSDDPQARTR